MPPRRHSIPAWNGRCCPATQLTERDSSAHRMSPINYENLTADHPVAA